MKYLFLTLSLASFGVFAQTKTPTMEMGDLNRKAVAAIKDAEIDKQLGGLSVFKECRDKNKFDPEKLDKADVNPNLTKAVDCFKQKIGAINDPKKLGELSDKLNLQGYGLIQSKNVQDISKYLGDKMYKSMTGVDKSSADLKATIASMRFSNPNRKMVDQQDFLELYKTQLVKSSLYEISRYCFEDFRYTSGAGRNTSPPIPSDFETHWGTELNAKGMGDPKTAVAAKPPLLSDDGDPSFFPANGDKALIYDDIVKGISKGSKAVLTGPMLQIFFNYCSGSILPLCDKFEKEQEKVTSKQVGEGVNIKDNNKIKTPGSKACLVKSRLQELRKAIANTDAVMKDWDKKPATEFALLLDGGKNATFYNGTKDASFDELTSQSSEEIMNGGAKSNSKLDELKNECAKNTTSEECKQFLVESNSFDKAQQSLDMEMMLKRELALERVRQLKSKNDKSLAEYLKTEGYLDILEKYTNNPNDPNFDVEQAVSNALEAKRLGALAALKTSMGKRQVSEKDATKAGAKETVIKENIKYTQDERARLAQVVMFNNIITSNLSLKDSTGKDLGKNVNAFNTEEKGFKNSKAQSPLFENLRTEVDKGPKSASTAGSSVLGTGILDTILGAPSK